MVNHSTTLDFTRDCIVSVLNVEQQGKQARSPYLIRERDGGERVHRARRSRRGARCRRRGGLRGIRIAAVQPPALPLLATDVCHERCQSTAAELRERV